MSTVAPIEPQIQEAAEVDVGRSREWRAFWRNPLGIAGTAVMLALILFSWVGPLIYRVSPNTTNLALIVQPPMPGHPLGTNALGQDELARMMVGGQISLIVGFAAAIAGMVLGVVYGLISAQYGYWVDTILMRFVDITIAIPSLYLLVMLDAILTPTPTVMVLIIALTSWQGIARIVRGEVLTLRQREFVEASRAAGTSRWTIMFRHYLPNTLGPIIVYTTFTVGGAILTLAALSFMGLGLPQEIPNWGSALNDGVNYMFQNAYWLIYPPGVLIVAAELAVNFLGDAFNAAFDPRLRGRS